MKKALVVYGGWPGHQPELVGPLFAEILEKEGFQVESRQSLDALTELDLNSFDLFVPVWTMGEISGPQVEAVDKAVQAGMGVAGCHGGMCDAFRNSTTWQFITGGQWVSHPGNDGVEYEVCIRDRTSPITDGLEDFKIKSEQYYLLTDPANHVLAVTPMPVAPGPHETNGSFNMPVVWTRRHGQGKVFYNSLGHQADVIDHGPARELMRRGFLWASR